MVAYAQPLESRLNCNKSSLAVKAPRVLSPVSRGVFVSTPPQRIKTMPAQPARITTEQSGIGGYQPWLSQDAGDPRVLAGTNYDFTASGVRSGFGSCSVGQLSRYTCNTPTNTFFQHDFAITLRGNKVLHCTQQNESVIFSFETLAVQHIDPSICYPWTAAYVGETYYYAHPCYGIISFDTFTQQWCQHTPASLGITSDIISVASFANRLFVLSTDTVSWSEIDNGLALDPNHITTAGFQSLNLAHFSTPYGIYATKFGVYIFTSAAIMHGRETDADNPFNFSTYDEAAPALGPQLITNYKSNILYAHANGLQLMGRAANNQFINEQLSPLMSDYLRTEVFPVYCSPHGCDMQLRYSQSREQIFLSFRNAGQVFFTHAYVYNIPYEKWSEFNELHETLLTIPSGTKQQHHNFGYIDNNSELQQFHTDVDVQRLLNQQIEPLQSTVIIGPLTAATEFVDQTLRITKVQIKNTNHESALHRNMMQNAVSNDRTTRPIHVSDICHNKPAEQQRYKVSCSGFIGNSDEYSLATELILQQRQGSSNYYVLNYTASHFNLQLTANSQGDYYEVASITLLGRVAGRL